MIRYIKIGDQILEGERQFAFFDTILDRFIIFNGGQVFCNKDEFREYAEDHVLFKRCMTLIPNEVV